MVQTDSRACSFVCCKQENPNNKGTIGTCSITPRLQAARSFACAANSYGSCPQAVTSTLPISIISRLSVCVASKKVAAFVGCTNICFETRCGTTYVPSTHNCLHPALEISRLQAVRSCHATTLSSALLLRVDLMTPALYETPVCTTGTEKLHPTAVHVYMICISQAVWHLAQQLWMRIRTTKLAATKSKPRTDAEALISASSTNNTSSSKAFHEGNLLQPKHLENWNYCVDQHTQHLLQC